MQDQNWKDMPNLIQTDLMQPSVSVAVLECPLFCTTVVVSGSLW